MRPLTMTLLSFFASMGLAIATRTFATSIEFQAISPASFTALLICALCALSALVCLWISLSYLLLAYAQLSTKKHGIVFKSAARLAIPHIRRTLLGVVALSLAIAQPAYADEYDNTLNDSIVDISWGSPDLVKIAEQNSGENTAPTPTPTQSPSETPSSPTPSPTSPLTSPHTSTTQHTPEIPTHSLPPPQTYTVKSGDTLWDIATHYLPAHASDSDIAQSCLLWARNNPNITNPNLIFPGQTLTIPQESLS